MDQENYNDIDMEIEMDSNDIDVSAEMPNEILVNNYNSLKNKPSINSVELVGNKTLEDLGITEYVEGEIANFDFIKIVPQLPKKGLINRTYFVPKTDPESNDLYEEYMWINNKWEMMGTKQIKIDLTDYVKNTDYAKTDKGGTIKTGNGVSLKNGVIQTDSIDYNAYKDSPNEYFIGKGTLEKVIEGKELINKEYSDNIVKEQRLENERLRNDIKSIALQGEASGENIHLEDSSEARCEIKICGNHVQDTREGYNLLDLSNFSTQTKNGVTATKNEDGSIKLVGTNSGDTFNFNLSTTNGEIGDYIASGVTGGSRETYFLAIVQPYVKTFAEVTNGSSNFSLTEEVTIAANIYIIKGATINTTIYPMMIKGTEQKPYEQYGASPSIDYPSPVKSVGNIKNILDMSNAKGGTSGGITCNMIADGSYTYKGTATSQYINVWFMGGYATDLPTLFTLEPGTYYINDVSLFEGTTGFANDSSKKIWTFTRAYNVTGVRAPNAVSGNTYDETKYPIIAKIDHEIPWVPYDCGYAKVDIVNENIFNTENIKSTSEVSVVDNKNGVLELQGVNGFWKGITTTQKFETGKRVYVKCKYVAGTGSAANIGIKDTNGDDILENYKVSNNLISCSFISKGITKIFFRCNGTSNNGNIKYSDIMFSYKDIDYIPHQEQSYLVDVQQEMLEGDYLDLENEKEHHEWGKYIFTGDEDYNKSQTYSNEKYFCGYIPTPVATNIKVDGKGICNYFNNFGDYVQITDKECIRIWGQFQVRILASRLTENSAEAFKTWLKSKYDEGNPVVVYYQLETPIELDFTNRQKLIAKQIKSEAHTYKNITNISAESSEVNPIINVKYLKDTEKYIENKITTALTEINAVNQVRTQMLDAEVEI